MAMLQACRHEPSSFVVVAVDHGLRPEAADECAFVLDKANKLGMAACVVSPRRLLRANMNEARRERLQLLLDAARDHGAHEIWLAHQEDDQAETVAMRLRRNSHWRGLAGLMATSHLEEKIIKRPLLHKSRAELRQMARPIGFVDDPSNDDPRFERVRMRSLLAKEPSLRLAMLRISKIARHWRAHHVGMFRQAHDAGLITLGPDHALVAQNFWRGLGVEARSWLADLLRMYFRPGQWPRGGEGTSKSIANLAPGGRVTLGFCLYGMSDQGLHVSREVGRIPPPATILPTPDDEWNLLDLFQKGPHLPIYT